MNGDTNGGVLARRLQVAGIGLLPLDFGPAVAGAPLSWIFAGLLLVWGLLLDKRTARAPSPAFNWVMAILLISILVAMSEGSRLGLATGAARSWIMITVAFWAVAVLAHSRASNPLVVMRGGLIISALAISAVRLTRQVSGTDLGLGGDEGAVLTQYYIQSAYIVALGVVALLHFALDRSSTQRNARRLAWVATLVAAAVVFGFASRSAVLMMAAGVALVVFGAFRTRRKSVPFAMLLIPATVLAAGALYYSAIGSALRVRFADSDALGANAMRREGIQELAREALLAHPLGIGWDGFTGLSSAGLYEAIRSAHSLYWGLGLSLGIVGAVAILGMIALNAMRGLFGKTYSGYLPGTLSAVILIAGLADDITVYPIGFSFILVLTSLGTRIVWPQHRD